MSDHSDGDDSKETSSLLGGDAAKSYGSRDNSNPSSPHADPEENLHHEEASDGFPGVGLAVSAAKSGIRKLKAALKRNNGANNDDNNKKAKKPTFSFETPLNVGAPLDGDHPLSGEDERSRSFTPRHTNLLNSYQSSRGKSPRGRLPYRPGSARGDDTHDDHPNDDDSCWTVMWRHVRREYGDSHLIRSLCSPSGYRRRQWHVIVLVSIIYNTITVPLRLGFSDALYRDYHNAAGMFLALDFTSDVVFYLHILLGFYTPYNDSGFYVTDRSLIWKHYLWNRFGLHMLASAPVYFFEYRLRVHALLRVPRMIWWIEVPMFFNMWGENLLRGFGHFTMQITQLLIIFLLLTHWIAAAFMAFAYEADFNSAWLPPVSMSHKGLTEQYVCAAFRAMDMLLGGPQEPEHFYEEVFLIVIMVIGSFFVATIIGSVADIVSQLNERDEQFRKKMDEINFFCADRKLPPELTARIRNHFINFWSRRGGIDDRSVFKELTPSLRKEVNVLLNKDIIQKCPLFRGCPDGFVHHVVSRLQSQIYCPGETIVKIGDVGYEMYFIGRGVVNIVIASGLVVGTLSAGAYFGEIAMVEDKSIRTATIEAKSFCDLFVLMKSDFLKVTKSYPEQLARMQFAAAQRRGKDELMRAVKNCVYFRGVDSREQFVADLVKHFEVVDKTFVGGDVVFDATDKAETLYFIGDGYIEIREEPVIPSHPLFQSSQNKRLVRKGSLLRRNTVTPEPASRVQSRNDGGDSKTSGGLATPDAGSSQVYNTLFSALNDRRFRSKNGKLIGTLTKGAWFGWIDTSRHAAGTQLLYNWVDDQGGALDFIEFSHAFKNALQAEELRRKAEANVKGTFAVNAIVSEKKALEYKAPPVVLFKLNVSAFDELMRSLYNGGPIEEFVDFCTEYSNSTAYQERKEYIAEDTDSEVKHDNRWLQQLQLLKTETIRTAGLFGEMNSEELKYVGEYLRTIQQSVHDDLLDIVQDVDDAEAEDYVLDG